MSLTVFPAWLAHQQSLTGQHALAYRQTQRLTPASASTLCSSVHACVCCSLEPIGILCVPVVPACCGEVRIFLPLDLPEFDDLEFAISQSVFVVAACTVHIAALQEHVLINTYCSVPTFVNSAGVCVRACVCACACVCVCAYVFVCIHVLETTHVFP